MKGLKKVPRGAGFLQHPPCRITLTPLHHIHASTLSTAVPKTEQQRAGSCSISTATGAATAHVSPTPHPCNKRDRLLRHAACCCSLPPEQPDGKASLTAAARNHCCSPNHTAPNSSSPPQASQGLRCRQMQREALHQPAWFSILYFPFHSEEAQVSKYSCTQLLSKCLVSFCFLFPSLNRPLQEPTVLCTSLFPTLGGQHSPSHSMLSPRPTNL